MWMAGGVDEDDKLDRGSAARLLRRTYGYLRESRRRLVLAAVLAVLYTATTLAGPLLVRTGIDDADSVSDTYAKRARGGRGDEEER